MCTTPDAGRVQPLVLRGSREETTFALVGCARSAQVARATDLYRQISAAVTRWVRQTESGREAYRQSSEDYNVGGLTPGRPRHPRPDHRHLLARRRPERLDLRHAPG
jgi:hypothetical protein